MGTWFDDEEASGRRLKKKPKRRRRRKKKPARPVYRIEAEGVNGKLIATRTGVVALVVVLCVMTLGLLAFTGVSVGRMLFSRNPRFAISDLRIKTGKQIPPALVKEWCQVDHGTNLFAVSVSDIREQFEAAPNVRDITVIRRLPGEITIEVQERLPLARLAHGRDRGLVVDEEGVIFGLRSVPRTLPSITGYDEADVQRGGRIEGMGLAGLQALAACRDHRLGIHVETVDVSRSDYLRVRTTTALVKLAWKGMGELTKESKAALMVQLRHLSRTLETPQGRRYSTFDATFPGEVIGQ